METPLLLAFLFFLAAVLYSSVGHAGASAYLAAMALVGVAPATMKPTALVLNLLVGTIATIGFARAGHFSLRRLWPFAVASIPMAYLGGAVQLPGQGYRILVGLALLVAAARLLFDSRRAPTAAGATRSPPLVPALAAGAAIGLLAGLTGTGGGIFLSPLLLLAGWTDTRQSGGITAPFVLVNSAAGLAGNLASVQSLPQEILLWAPAALLGGLLGSGLGATRVETRTFRRLLALVLVVAGLKLILSP